MCGDPCVRTIALSCFKFCGRSYIAQRSRELTRRPIEGRLKGLEDSAYMKLSGAASSP